MKKILGWAIISFITISLIMCAWSLLHGDIYYYTDIGRDFLIMDEIAQKKVVLIGPRADFKGLFHGIAWHYLNMPVYLLGRGNPIVVGWFWYLLTLGLIAQCYYIASKLFDKRAALIILFLLPAYLVPIVQGFFHGNGAMLVLPAFLYLFIRYVQTEKARYLAAHFVLLGLIAQFEIALGMPLVILSTIASLFFIIQKKQFKHLVCFGVLPIMLASFILIELRHNFLMVRSMIEYLQGARDGVHIPYIESFSDRVYNISTRGFNLFKDDLHQWNRLILLLFIGTFYKVFKNKHVDRTIYAIFLYFFVGFYALTLLHGGHIIMFWWLPMTVLPLLIFSSFHRHIPIKLFYGFVGLVLAVTVWQNVVYLQRITGGFGKDLNSWAFRLNIAKTVFDDAPAEFGYYIYSPDIYGYQDKYAMSYGEKISTKKAHVFEKQKTTYVVVEPPPKDKPGLSPNWWVSERLKIKNRPVKTIPLLNGYEVRKYALSEDEVKVPAEITVSEWWLFYR